MKNHDLYPLNDVCIWKPIAGYEDRYEISTKGEVRSIDRVVVDKRRRLQHKKSVPITVNIDRAGYPTVVLKKANGSRGTQYVHRLLALTFIPKPANKGIVNHKNGDKLDNSLDNLEWVTRSENSRHAIRTGLSRIPSQSMTRVKDICTGQEFDSMMAAARFYRMDYFKLKKMLKGWIANTTCLRLTP
jgi:hypothetical protein